MQPLDGAIQAATAIGLILAAAKAHGRQLRLERVQAGYASADFRGPNPPWVETLWRNDRVGFWVLFPALAAGALAWSLSNGASWLQDVFRVALAFAAALFVMGVQSLWRLADRDEEGWKSDGIGSSFLWWTLVAALFGIAAGLGQ